MTPTAEKKVLHYEDVHALPEGHYEIIEGKRVEMTPTGFTHGKFELKIANFLGDRLKDRGHVAVGEIGIVIAKRPFRLRAADVVYISKKTSPKEPEGILEIAPDLIVEILSKNDTVWKMNDKIKDYLSIGVKRLVIVDPYAEFITVYQNSKKEAANFDFDEAFELVDGVKIKMRDVIES